MPLLPSENSVLARYIKRLTLKVASFFVYTKMKIDAFLKRRPHRSFRRTYRRDYVRSLHLPGYFNFTKEVAMMLWRNRKVFITVSIVYAILTGLLVGFASQESYTQLNETITESSGDLFEGNWGQLGQAGLVFLATITGGVNSSPTEAQQIYGVLISLLTWLTTVWLLRNILAGHKVRARDGMYGSGSPLLPTFLVSLVIVLQLLPLILALIGYSAAQASGLLTGGVESMLFWLAAGLLATLSLYWITSTFIALVIVTLPGMYPYQALKTAGDVVVGRRIRILLRLLWLALFSLLVLVLVMLPVIIFDTWIKSIVPWLEWIPMVPTMLLLMSALGIVWAAAYIYILYRKVVDDDAKPAL